MKIKSVYIDGLHNAVNKTYEFGDLVYIFGNNGAGKSTILQAIQFALLGYFPGTAKTKEAMLRHSPKKAITVCLTLDEATVERKLTTGGNNVSTIPTDYDLATIVSDLELPIFNFNEFAGQTANKLKEYFIKNILPTAGGELDWKQILIDSIADCNFDDRDAVIEYGMTIVKDLDGTVLDQVIEANTKFKAEQSFNKSEAQRLQNTVDSLIYYDDYVGSTNMDELNANLLSLGAIRDQLIKYESARTAVQATRNEYDKLSVDVENLGGQAEYDRINTELTDLRVQEEALNEAIASKNHTLAVMQVADKVNDEIINSKGMCPFTKEACKSILARIDDIRNGAVTHKAEKMELTDEINKLSGDLSALQLKIRQAGSVIMDFQNIWNRLGALKDAMGDLPEKPATDKTLAEIDVEIEALTQSKAKLQANIQYNETIENITKMKFETELQGEALAKWVKTTDTNGLQTTLMLAPFEELANTMTGYIRKMYGREDIEAHFNISNKANSFSFGLIREGVYIPYDLLSSGEKCLYTLALMICIVNNSKSPMKVLLCDDMFDHLDSIAIESTFTALKNVSDIQFIFAGVKDCDNARDVMLKIG